MSRVGRGCHTLTHVRPPFATSLGLQQLTCRVCSLASCKYKVIYLKGLIYHAMASESVTFEVMSAFVNCPRLI